MNQMKTAIQAFLQEVPPLASLSAASLNRLLDRCQLLQYPMGRSIVLRGRLPAQVAIIYQGQVRLLGHDPLQQEPVTLEILGPGDFVGAASLTRQVACESAIASTEVTCIVFPAADFLNLLTCESSLADAFQQRSSSIEVFELLGAQLENRADSRTILEAFGTGSLKELALMLWPGTRIYNLSPGKQSLNQLDSDWVWVASGGNIPEGLSVGSRVHPQRHRADWTLRGTRSARLVGFPKTTLTHSSKTSLPAAQAVVSDTSAGECDVPATPSAVEVMPFPSGAIEVAPEQPLALESEDTGQRLGRQRYPFKRGSGPLGTALACFQMLCRHLDLPFRSDVVRRILNNQLKRSGALSLQHCAVVGEFIGLSTQLAAVPEAALGRLPTPAAIVWQGGFALIYEVSQRQVVLAAPATGLQRLSHSTFLELWRGDSLKQAETASEALEASESTSAGALAEPSMDALAGEPIQVLLLRATKYTPQQRFGLSWFWPSIVRYRWALLEVFLASFFVQLLGLANPLMTQIIIDRVLVQNSVQTLNSLGVLLIAIAIFEAVMGSLRTYLFVNTTNRIDLALGSQIIDRLLRLPLRYFERRPVGELSSRVNELENIRQFLTGTALTVVLDAVFSVIYILVMVLYSWLLTLVALATVPLFALLTFIVSPIIRRQIRTKAERNAETQSYLVEALSGIQTVKAQNIELRSRWQWQERYGRYVRAGFKTVVTSTAAGSTSNFLNKFSSLLLLWLGAYLVLQGELTLGQLIAFRIIAGYATSPLLRLIQLWQNFQETAISLERLADIVDTPQESDETDRGNIAMPVIQGAVSYEAVSFRFDPSGALQLNNIHLDVPAGAFVGIVGESGSGKSTLLKVLARLYEPESGRILVDRYDINKVELYSLRSQIGIVPQEPLLFDGTVRENIALTNPDATDEAVIIAAQVAAAHDFIMTLPNGYNTRVGERGSALSGGQRQRIAIARTVLQEPRLLVLDEATSALDYTTEAQVSRNLAAAFRDRTVFFITHRLATIRNADLIIVMERGAIIEQGNHSDLMTSQGHYYCLYQQQNFQSS